MGDQFASRVSCVAVTVAALSTLAAVIYLVLTTIFTFIFEKIEYRAGIYEQR